MSTWHLSLQTLPNLWWFSYDDRSQVYSENTLHTHVHHPLPPIITAVYTISSIKCSSIEALPFQRFTLNKWVELRTSEKLEAMPKVAQLQVGSPKLKKSQRRSLTESVPQRGGAEGSLQHKPGYLGTHTIKSKLGPPDWGLGMRLSATSPQKWWCWEDQRKMPK